MIFLINYTKNNIFKYIYYPNYQNDYNYTNNMSKIVNDNKKKFKVKMSIYNGEVCEVQVKTS
jgi:hypothetical protein